HLLMALDARGVAVSAGAACASGAGEPSGVLSAMGVPRELAVCAVRLFLGRTPTAADVEAVVGALRQARPVAVAGRAPATAGRRPRAGGGRSGGALVKRLTVLAAMSGGVDSAVASALLAEQGHAVTGVTLKLWCYGRSPLSPRACCTLDAIDDARRVAARMGFPHFVVEAEEVFRDRVLQPFLDAYAGGRTPYPCALRHPHPN